MYILGGHLGKLQMLNTLTYIRSRNLYIECIHIEMCISTGAHPILVARQAGWLAPGATVPSSTAEVEHLSTT